MVFLKKNTAAPESGARVNKDVVLNLLRDISAEWEAKGKRRRELGRLAIEVGATYQEVGEAIERDRSTAHTMINGRAA
jgi:hypothetical protein